MPTRNITITMTENELVEIIEQAVTQGVVAALAEVQGQTLNTSQLLTRTQLARHLQVTPNQVTRLVHRGMPSLGCGADRRFRLSDVVAWMGAQDAANSQ